MIINNRTGIIKAGLVWIVGIILCGLIYIDYGVKNTLVGLISILLCVFGVGSWLSYVFKFSIRMFLFKKAGYINEPSKSIFTIILEIILEYLKIRNNKNE